MPPLMHVATMMSVSLLLSLAVHSIIQCVYTTIPQMCLYQGVVTYMSPVEAFATGIKIESSDQSPFWEPIKGSSPPPNYENQRIKNTPLQFDLWPIKNQAIKSFLKGRSSDQAHFLLIKKYLDPSRKRFNRRHTVHVFKNDAALRNVFPDLRLRRSFATNRKASTDDAECFFRCCGMLLLKKPSEDAESF